MTILPAIDLLDGKCVRLFKGDYDKSKTYDRDPVETAMSFQSAGTRRIHIVDLDAARGQGHNREVFKQIRHNVKCTLEVGGGIRSEKDVEELLEAGVDRLILGTILTKEPALVTSWVNNYGPHFVAGIDALDGIVKVAGWEESGGMSDLELARKVADMGLISIIYTNIDRDGTLEGPDVERTMAISEASGLPTIVSGGISSLDDCIQVVEASKDKDPGISGIITGKAIYEGHLDLIEAIAQIQTPDKGLW